MALLRLFLLVTCVVALSQAFGTGAPKGACSTLLPKHANSTSVKGGHPQYRLEVPSIVSPRDPTQIILRGANFRGFIVRALNRKGSSGGGQFKAGKNSKPLNCKVDGDTATHDNPTPKTEVILDWTAPTEIGVYTVKATFVETHAKYYIDYSTFVTVQ